MADYATFREGEYIRIRKLNKPHMGDWFDLITVDQARELATKLHEAIEEAA